MKIGDIYQIFFLDHTCFTGEEGEPLTCEVIGRITKISKQHVELTVWAVERAGWQNNNEGICIVRSCITKSRRLR